MATALEKLRTDLEISPEGTSGVIVKDPVTRRFYRFTPVQATVLELLDGSRDLAAIAAEASEKHRTEVLEDQLEDFVGKLRHLLLLDHPYCWTRLEGVARGSKGSFKNLLSIKLHAFNPDRTLTLLEKRLRFFFSPAFSAIFWVAAVVAGILSIVHARSLFVSMGSLFSLYSIPLILLVVFTVVTIHEFGHGLTLKHHGGRVEEMGVMLLYFIPAFYCNVSDAWMLGRRERLLVSVAGGYIQIFLWALATIAWRILAPETLASQVCLIIIAFSGIQTLFNFNPLIRLDGYYMLSDYVQVPNLRPKALAYLKNRVVGFITGTPAAGAPAAGAPAAGDGPNRRERRILVWYGLASSLFTVVLVAVMLHRIGGWIIQEYRFWGILATSALFLATIPITRKENVETSRKLLTGMIIRIRKKPLIYMGLLLLALLVGFLPWQLKISGEFAITAAQKVSVSPQVDGNLMRIHVDQGDRVQSGQLLAEIENLELSNSYEETRGELASQRASLDLLKAGSRPEEIENARRQVETKRAELYNASRVEQERALLRETIAKRESELKNAQLNYERTLSLLNSGLIARIEADRDRTAFEVQQKELAEARGQLSILEEQTDRNRDIKRKELAQAESQLNILLAGARKESVRASESQVSKLEEKLGILEQQREKLKVRSPIEGIVATAHLQNRIGDYLEKGDPFCDIVSEGSMLIEMPVPEKEIGEVSVGMPISLKVRGYPGRWYEAHVKSIAPVAATTGTDRTVLVHGELTNTDGTLKSGMTGVGKILCGKRTVFAIAFRRAVRWIRTEFWEYLP